MTVGRAAIDLGCKSRAVVQWIDEDGDVAVEPILAWRVGDSKVAERLLRWKQ